MAAQPPTTAPHVVTSPPTSTVPTSTAPTSTAPTSTAPTSTAPSEGAATAWSGALGLAGFLALAAALLWWAKWSPYTGRVQELSASGAWSGTSLLAGAGVEPGSGPSLRAGVEVVRVYGLAVWKAVLAGLVIAAAVQSLVPRPWLVRTMTRSRPAASALVGGLLSTPSMMCSCCAAPVASALRRSGVPTASVVAYWLGNPLLNPAVLVFLVLVAPWEWAATRLLVGTALVVLGSTLVARLTDRRVPPSAAAAVAATVDAEPAGGRARRFASTLLRTSLVVVPEYVLVVALVGTFSGWLFPLGDDARSWGVLAVLVAVVLGTLMVIPTAGEIPLAQGLALAGLGAPVVGALLVVLPAISLPSMVMVLKALGWRVTALTGVLVATGGLAAAVLLPVLIGV